MERCEAPGWDLWSANVGGTSGDRSCREAIVIGPWGLVFFTFFLQAISIEIIGISYSKSKILWLGRIFFDPSSKEK